MLRFVPVAVGEGRELGCARCELPPAPSYRTVGDVRASIVAAVSGWVGGPGPNVVLTGPEPFAHPELPALVAACADAGVERIAIETDGGALSVEGNAAGVLQAGVRHVRVRVLAGDEALAEGLTGRPGLARAARAGIAEYLAAADASGQAVAVTAIVPVCGHNLAVLPATIAALAEWGVHAARIIARADLGPDATAFVIAACDTGMVNRLWVETEGFILPETHALHVVPEVGAGD